MREEEGGGACEIKSPINVGEGISIEYSTNQVDNTVQNQVNSTVQDEVLVHQMVEEIYSILQYQMVEEIYKVMQETLDSF